MNYKMKLKKINEKDEEIIQLKKEIEMLKTNNI